jgi:hypothetical protein
VYRTAKDRCVQSSTVSSLARACTVDRLQYRYISGTYLRILGHRAACGYVRVRTNLLRTLATLVATVLPTTERVYNSNMRCDVHARALRCILKNQVVSRGGCRFGVHRVEVQTRDRWTTYRYVHGELRGGGPVRCIAWFVQRARVDLGFREASFRIIVMV